MLRNRLLATALTAVTAFGLAACGSADQPSDETTKAASADGGQDAQTDADKGDAAEADTTANSEVGPIDLAEAKKFVRITACAGAPAQPVGVTATVEVTNERAEPTEYYGSVTFLDGTGAVLAEGVFNTGTVEPGATATEEIPGANVYQAVPEVTCELADVAADHPE